SAPSSPIPGCRNNSGRPRPRSINSTRTPLIVMEEFWSLLFTNQPWRRSEAVLAGRLLLIPLLYYGKFVTPTKFREMSAAGAGRCGWHLVSGTGQIDAI